MVIVSHNIVVKTPGMLQRHLKAIKLSWQNYLQQVSDHQVVNELNGERLKEPNEVFKRYRSSNKI